jgi:hypothetical protein
MVDTSTPSVTHFPHDFFNTTSITTNTTTSGYYYHTGEPSEKTLGGYGEGCWAVWDEVVVEKEKVGRAAWFLLGCGSVS